MSSCVVASGVVGTGVVAGVVVAGVVLSGVTVAGFVVAGVVGTVVEGVASVVSDVAQSTFQGQSQTDRAGLKANNPPPNSSDIAGHSCRQGLESGLHCQNKLQSEKGCHKG